MISDNVFNWLTKALTKNRNDLNNYVYDRKTNTLFAYSISGTTLIPWYRNRSFRIDEIEKRFEEELSKVKNADSNIISLPYLSLEEKKIFLSSFISEIDSNLIKDKLVEDLQSFDENSSLTFGISLKEIEVNLAFSFEKAKWKFISQKINELYKPLGVDESVNALY